MHPELFHVGSFVLPTYGVILAIGFFAALALVRMRAPRFGIASEAALDVSVWILLWALLGSKLLLVVVEWPRHVTSLSGLGELLRSAGVFYGGLIGAVVAGIVLLRSRGIPFFTYADVGAPAIAIGQAIGRLGCFAAGCCWGRDCHEPWAVVFRDPKAFENVGVPLGVPLHPTQLYEAAGTLLLCGLLILFEKRRFSGETFGRYLTGYAALRFTIEFFRGDPRGSVLGAALSTSQAIALAGFVAGVAILVLRRGKAPSPAAA